MFNPYTPYWWMPNVAMLNRAGFGNRRRIKDVGIYRYDDYPLDYLEWFECEYTTPGGETVVAFGQYGYD